MENNNSNNNEQNTPTLEQQIDDLYRKIKGYENEYAETTNKKEKKQLLASITACSKNLLELHQLLLIKQQQQFLILQEQKKQEFLILQEEKKQHQLFLLQQQSHPHQGNFIFYSSLLLT